MSNWDDEDFEVSTAAVSRNDFDDEDEDALLDDWEAAGESEEEEGPVKPLKNKVGAEQRKADREAKEQAEREKKAMASAEEDAATRKERLKQAELNSDLNNAAELFSSVDIHPRSKKTATISTGPAAAAQPQKLSDLQIFKPTSKQEFENLRKTLAPLLAQLNEVSGLHYSNFVTELCRDVCKPLATDQIRKVSSTLTALQNEKIREERMNRGKKKKPVAKAASLKVDEAKDTTNYDDFDDDDFM